MTPFERDVARVVASIAAGEVMAYGEVAAESGHPGSARAVGSFLARSEGFPWWRVVSAGGRLVPGNEREHARRLAAEGVELRDGGVVLGVSDAGIK